MAAKALRVAVVLVVFALAISPANALMLAGNVTPAPATAVNSPCPEHPGHYSISDASVATILTTGPCADFTTAWNTALPGIWNPALWTLNWSTETLAATLDLTAYQAFNLKPGDPGYSSAYAGAEIRIEWNPTAEQQNLRWVQAIHTNRSRYPATQYYLDVLPLRPPQDQPPAYPYSYADCHFYDKPSRWCEPDQRIFWDAYLYLARVDRVARSVTVYEGLQWGYTIDCLVPEPSMLVPLLVAVAATMWRRSKS